MLQPQQTGAPAASAFNPLSVQASSFANVKDSRWLTLEVCREFQRNKCSRTELECKFSHPPPHVEIVNGRVTACYDSIKGRCTRKEPPCKYLHPPQHLREQLLQNGKNNLILRNLQLQAIGASAALPFTPVLPMQDNTQQVLPEGLYPTLSALTPQQLMYMSPWLDDRLVQQHHRHANAMYPGAGLPQGLPQGLQQLGSPFLAGAQLQGIPGSIPSPGLLVSEASVMPNINSPSTPNGTPKLQTGKVDRIECQGVMPMVKRPTLDTRSLPFMPGMGMPGAGAYPGNAALLQPYPYMQQLPLSAGTWGANFQAAQAGAAPTQLPQFMPVSCDYLTGQPTTLPRF